MSIGVHQVYMALYKMYMVYKMGVQKVYMAVYKINIAVHKAYITVCNIYRCI